MLIALLVFFLAALSGTIALTMAASNAGRYTHERGDQQAYLSVVSAANLILDRLAGLTIIYQANVVDHVPLAEGELKIVYQYAEGREADLFLADEDFKKNLRNSTLTNAPGWEEVSFSLSAPANGEMGEVFVSVNREASIFSFRLYHKSGSARNYQMTLEVGSAFQEGAYTQDSEDKYYKRHMTFETKSAKFIVEKNVPSGGTTE